MTAGVSRSRSLPFSAKAGAVSEASSNKMQERQRNIKLIIVEWTKERNAEERDVRNEQSTHDQMERLSVTLANYRGNNTQ